MSQQTDPNGRPCNAERDCKEPKRDISDSVSLLHIKCHDNANGKRLNKYGLFHVWLVSQEETAQVCKEFEF